MARELNNPELTHLIDLQLRRNIFERFRREVRFVCVPVFLLFGFVDFYFFPEHAPFWVFLRCMLSLILMGIFEFLKVSWIRNRYSQHLAVLGLMSATGMVNWMIYESGSTVYVTGMIMAQMVGESLLRVNKTYALSAQLLAYIPCSLAIWAASAPGEQRFAILQSIFLFTGAIMSFISTHTEAIAHTLWMNNQINLNHELVKLNRSEFLKRNFPPELRAKIEDGTLKLNRHKIVDGAVVGFADIISSTSIANNVDLMTDWQVKEAFLVAATRRATECGLIVLTHTGDGFLFLANYDASKQSSNKVTRFFQFLSEDFETIAKAWLTPVLRSSTGIKCGVAMGPTVVGFLGENQSYFTAVGPDVNLAARLCSKAGPNELVISSRVWFTLDKNLDDWFTQERLYSNLKGFRGDIPAYHLQRKSAIKTQVA